MKLPKLFKTKIGTIKMYLQQGYVLRLYSDSALIKNLPKLMDLFNENRNNFHDPHRLQCELMELNDKLLNIETQKEDTTKE